MDEDDDDESDKVHWVDRNMAVLHEECWKEKTGWSQVHAPAEGIVEHAPAVIPPFCFLLLRCHWVKNDAEGDEERVLREEQNDEEATDVAMRELVDSQVENDDRLETKQALSLAPFSMLDMFARVEVKTTNHEERHHAALEDDPTLFDSIAQRAVVFWVIEIIIRDPRVPLAFHSNLLWRNFWKVWHNTLYFSWLCYRY